MEYAEQFAHLGDAVRWLMSWDFMAIIYSLIGSALLAFILSWFGGLRWIKRRFRSYRGTRSYRKSLQSDCEALIVVGRRHGFLMKEVYIPLDLAPSNLMPEQKEKPRQARGSYVVVGGPGAGKSTIGKKRVLEALERNNPLPFFVRLREYSGSESIEELLTQKLAQAGIPDPELVVQAELDRPESLCALDGLDEVRPHVRQKLCSDINKFYHRNFENADTKTLLVTCRKEAYRDIPLDIPMIWEVRPLTDNQMQRFAEKWPFGYPVSKNKDTFWRDLAATPRILELARSPLLLVGGLMQYTESNLGIPDERFQYLARVARWLTVDWATAQGHPPDPNRPIYDRILARMALHLHSNQSSECPIQEAHQLVSSWLPNYGYQESQADDILSSIATKTGILVSEGNSNFIFVQFGLQEYFVSLGVVDNYGVEAVANLQPKQWWREAILLAAAQQRDPTPLLEALFRTDPLLAAAAVAECPTPSTAMQSQAVATCLMGIDAKDKSVSASVVPLLRKLTGQRETDLCSSLETRLSREDEIASLVGIALATAGTEAATGALGRHPDIWDKCLSEAGYLSASFENMLVDWIQKGNDSQSNRAAELISGRLSGERFIQLVSMLPELLPARREKLASLLLLQLETKEGMELFPRHQFYPARRYAPDFALWVVSQCAPHIGDRESFIRRREAEFTAGRRYYSPFDVGDLISTALCVERSGKRSSPEELLRLLLASLRWATCKSALFCWLFAGVFYFIPTSASFLWSYIALLGVVLILSHLHRLGPLWSGGFVYFRSVARMDVTFILMLASALLAIMFRMEERSILNAQALELSHLGMILFVTFIGIAIEGKWESFGPSITDDRNDARDAKCRLYNIAPISFAVLVAATGVGKMLLNLPGWWAYVTTAGSVILIGVAVSLLAETAYSALIVSKASRRGAQIVSKFRRG